MKIQSQELRLLVAAARAQGWEVEPCTSGHWRFIPPCPGLGLVYSPKTTSDHRALLNTRAQLERRGLVVRGRNTTGTHR